MVDRFHIITNGKLFSSILYDGYKYLAQATNPEMVDICKLLNKLHNENVELKKQLLDYQPENESKLMKIIDDKLDEYLHRLDNFKKLENPANPRRVQRQIDLHEAVIMTLLEIKGEYEQ